VTEALIDYGLLFSLTIFKQFLNAFPISLNISEKLLLGNDFLDIRGSRKYSFGTIGIITFSSPAQTNIVTETRVNMQQLGSGRYGTTAGRQVEGLCKLSQ